MLELVGSAPFPPSTINQGREGVDLVSAFRELRASYNAQTLILHSDGVGIFDRAVVFLAYL